METGLVYSCYTRAREELGRDDPVRAVLDLVERHDGTPLPRATLPSQVTFASR